MTPLPLAPGNRPLQDPDALDSACHRSADSYARVLARGDHRKVRNLACAGATVRDGILGVQILGGSVAPPQLDEAQRATHAKAVTVNVGANDVRWADLVELCAKAPSCNDKASTEFFQEQLGRFTHDYRTLLARLVDLPKHPKIVIHHAREEALTFADVWSVDGPILLDETGDYAAALGISGVPPNVLVDERGIVRAVGAVTPAALERAAGSAAPPTAPRWNGLGPDLTSVPSSRPGPARRLRAMQ